MRLTIDSLRFVPLALTMVVALAGRPTAQTQIDGVLLKFEGEIITQSDVRQARVLKLVTPRDAGDAAYVDALADRRLMLAEVRRASIPDPPAADLDKRYREWAASVGAGDVTALLSRVGMSEAGLRAWLREDLRIQAYLDRRFTTGATRAADVAAWIGELRRRAGLK